MAFLKKKIEAEKEADEAEAAEERSTEADPISADD